MIDISKWDFVYKRDYWGEGLATTNMLYTPVINPDLDVMCMIWDENHPYQQDNKNISKKLVDFFFQRELEHLKLFQGRPWCPKLIDVDIDNRRIFIEYNKESINHIVMDPERDLNAECSDWKDQIYNIVSDIYDSGYYKVALYPHCFFIDKNNKIKTFDYYSCVSRKERYLDRADLEGMIGNHSTDRFNMSTVDGKIDFEIFFKLTMSSFLDVTWKDNPFPDFYQKLTSQNHR